MMCSRMGLQGEGVKTLCSRIRRVSSRENNFIKSDIKALNGLTLLMNVQDSLQVIIKACFLRLCVDVVHFHTDLQQYSLE